LIDWKKKTWTTTTQNGEAIPTKTTKGPNGGKAVQWLRKENFGVPKIPFACNMPSFARSFEGFKKKMETDEWPGRKHHLGGGPDAPDRGV